MAFADHPPGLPSLRCRDLNLPQQICIWFVRRAYHAGVEATERTATKVFGPPAMGEALTALDALVDALHRSPLEGPPVHALRAPVQSKEEFDLLTAFAVSQHAGVDAGRALADRWGWPAAPDSVEVGHAVSRFAAFLDHAAQRLPPPQGRPSLACAGADSTEDLDPRECSLVRAIRVWVRCVRRTLGVLPPPRAHALNAREILLGVYRIAAQVVTAADGRPTVPVLRALGCAAAAD